MANNFSNVMDGSRLTEQNIYTCRLCLKQFLYYSDYAFHERMHFDQVPLPGSLQGGLRPAYDNHVVPPYNSTSSTPGTLDSFDKLIQPFRSTIPEADIRSQTDSRGLVPSSQQDLRNYVPSSPADHRNMAVTSPADPRNMVATSPGDPRNMVASSPADPRNLIPSSPADSRNMIPSSPADPRNMVPASPVDPRNLVPASPVDPRNMVPASPVDPRNMVPASPVDPRNMVPASPVDPRNMVPASPVDPRNLVPASPAAQQDPRNLMVSSPASLPDKSTQQLYRSDIEGQNINLGSRSTPINIQSPSVSMATVPMSTDVRLLPVDTRPLQSQVTDSRHLPADSLTYSSPSFLDSLTRSLYTPDLTNKPMSTPPFSSLPMCRPEDILGLDSRQHQIQKPDPYYGIPKSIYHQSSGTEAGDNYANNQYGLSKLLSPQQGTYYQQNMSSQPQTLYGIDKLTSTPLNYYNQPNSNDKSSTEQRDTVPKQTLHYGPVSTPNHSHFQHSIPRSDQQHTNPSQQKVLNSTEQLPAYQSGHVSPHLTYSQVYKGSQPQAQVW
ncbi:uncharacterized protein LOC123559589 [Mercenaria mercenaria]|uniref:uncharacterized protein LOC123559589 n=1 Tax=Mercenaria mercenaria TaxID=6596 RepID=UPI00234F7760|nr:uncharacterized protein LOC123559589 [Mercenaria mercenaria]XP_053408529.1 uncharacterized protein LOC123559589 [Mercenaria mercenaria]